jgi:hypothetical protein
MGNTPQSAGEIQFYTVATDNDGLTETSPVYADLTATISEGPTPAAVPALDGLVLLVLVMVLLTVGAIMVINQP